MINLPQQGDVVMRSPITELRLYSGIPWDDTYRHVRLYDSEEQLLSSLEQWRVFRDDTRLTELSPIRVGESIVRIPITEMQTLGINYLAFKNHGLSDKWVFCFVNRIEWMSENSTRLYFKRDIFQDSWYGITIKPCFVEYHHIPRSEDTLFNNLLPVNIDTGDMIIASHQWHRFKPTMICTYVSDTPEGGGIEGKVDNGIYRAFQLGTWATSEFEDVNQLVKYYTDKGKIDALMCVFMAPPLCTNAIKNDGSNIETFTITRHDNYLFEGYVPKNKKLYSYPFTYLLADNNEGQSNIFRWEYSYSNGGINFESTGCISTLPQVMTTPIDYRDSQPSTRFPDYMDAFVNSAFPLCGFQSDTFRAWVAQNKSSISLNAIGNISKIGGGLIASVATGGIASALGASATASGINGALSQIAQLSDIERQPNTIKGKALSENINVAMGITGIDFYEMSCKAEFAKVADNFFEMYGYPIKKIVTPNLRSRSSWNYVKTQDCGFTGNVELDDLKTLRDIFNKGVTLWHTDDVGNYGLENN